MRTEMRECELFSYAFIWHRATKAIAHTTTLTYYVIQHFNSLRSMSSGYECSTKFEQLKYGYLYRASHFMNNGHVFKIWPVDTAVASVLICIMFGFVHTHTHTQSWHTYRIQRSQLILATATLFISQWIQWQWIHAQFTYDNTISPAISNAKLSIFGV